MILNSKIFLQVSDRSDLNKMNEKNLALVFGPNLIRPREVTETVFIKVGAVNLFTECLLLNQQELFY